MIDAVLAVGSVHNSCGEVLVWRSLVIPFSHLS
jgi:hypothetical protein